MFGHDNNDQNQTQTDQTTVNDPAMVTPTPDGSLGSSGADHTQNTPGMDASDATPMSDNTQADASDDQGQGAPAVDTSSSSYEVTPVGGQDNDAATPTSVPATRDDDDLMDIKQQALQQLSPLVGHLDQTPEEKFKTTMMMIQASDDRALVKTAYEAAQAISDEKTRAQALLDVVNEINYFTHQSTE